VQGWLAVPVVVVAVVGAVIGAVVGDVDVITMLIIICRRRILRASSEGSFGSLPDCPARCSSMLPLERASKSGSPSMFPWMIDGTPALRVLLASLCQLRLGMQAALGPCPSG